MASDRRPQRVARLHQGCSLSAQVKEIFPSATATSWPREESRSALAGSCRGASEVRADAWRRASCRASCWRGARAVTSRITSFADGGHGCATGGCSGILRRKSAFSSRVRRGRVRTRRQEAQSRSCASCQRVCMERLRLAGRRAQTVHRFAAAFIMGRRSQVFACRRTELASQEG